MNNDLFLILSSIKSALGNDRSTKSSTDYLCNYIYEIHHIGCNDIHCSDCIVGYKDSTQYAHQIIQTWKIL